jgi:acyl-CoA thioester hydrolase
MSCGRQVRYPLKAVKRVKKADTRASYPHFTRIDTRWNDNDVYGHVNNVVYYSFFDTAVNAHLIRAGCLDVLTSATIGLVVETQCQYFRPVAFPDVVHAGMRVAKLGTSSVRYELALFANDDDSAAAQGHFVHVYVDRATNKPVPIPERTRRALQALMRPDA